MDKAVRFDNSRFDKYEITPEGFLRVDAFATRVGVFTYRKADGSVVRELRPPEEVFHPDSIKSLRQLPVTNDHPSELLTSKDAKKYMVGSTGENVDKADQFLKTSVTVYDADTIEDIKAGKQEVSCGYESELEESPGVFQGEKYDVIQRNIRYNHLAIVNKGRAGPDVRLRMDSNSAVLQEGVANEKEKQMEKISIAGKEYDCSPELAAAIKGMMAQQGEMDSKMAGLQKQVDAFAPKQEEMNQMAQAKDALQAKCDSLEEKLKAKMDSADPKKVDELVKKRLHVMTVATKVLPKETKLDGKSDLEIMKEVVAAKAPKANLEGKSETYIQVRFDSIAEDVEANAEAEAELAKSKEKAVRQDAAVPSSEEARKKMIEESQSSWKTPSGKSKA